MKFQEFQASEIKIKTTHVALTTVLEVQMLSL
jgi:hypothetical protein